jgi:hypothetical protein
MSADLVFPTSYPVDPAAFPAPAANRPDLPSRGAADRVWRLLYTGSVYSAQASAFRNLNTALCGTFHA